MVGTVSVWLSPDLCAEVAAQMVDSTPGSGDFVAILLLPTYIFGTLIEIFSVLFCFGKYGHRVCEESQQS